jgi:uncharacterized protein (DUF433 family)
MNIMIQLGKSDVVLAGPQGEPLIRKTVGVCGGDACVGDSRIMVWLLASERRAGRSDSDILKRYPSLTTNDLAAVWEYARQHPDEIDEAIANQEEDGDESP